MLIIAEFGSSPSVDGWPFARWCEGARAVGADGCKTQLFWADHFPESERAQKRPLEFPRERMSEYMRCARAHGLQAGASVFDAGAADLAARHCDFIKLAAREQANHALYQKVTTTSARLGLPIYRSVSDLRLAVYHPLITTLFVIPQYPAPMLTSVLGVVRACMYFRRRGLRWGWSSHTRGDLDCVLAKRLGAVVLEKHFALGSTDLEAGHSLLPPAFSRMVERIRQ